MTVCIHMWTDNTSRRHDIYNFFRTPCDCLCTHQVLAKPHNNVLWIKSMCAHSHLGRQTLRTHLPQESVEFSLRLTQHYSNRQTTTQRDTTLIDRSSFLFFVVLFCLICLTCCVEQSIVNLPGDPSFWDNCLCNIPQSISIQHINVQT